jgi:hypothetical protein
MEWYLIGVLAFSLVLSVWSNRAAYRNGVTDGYGYAREPNCPGYAVAGEYLRKWMSHRWVELGNGIASELVGYESMEQSRKRCLDLAESLGSTYLKDKILASKFEESDALFPLRRHQNCPKGGLLRCVGYGAIFFGLLIVCDECGESCLRSTM